MSIITLVPSYGRDYKNQEEVQKAWDDGKDFIIYQWDHKYDGKPINKEGAEVEGGTFSVRFKNKTKKALILCARKVG